MGDWKKTVAVDVDGVLAQYKEGWKGIDHFGEPIFGAKEFLTTLKKHYYILIYTTRCNEEMNKPEKAVLLRKRVEAWLTKYEIPYDEIFIGQGKPIVGKFIDDNALECRADYDPAAYQRILARLVPNMEGIPQPCWHCGNAVTVGMDSHEWIFVECQQCGVRGPWAEDADEAVRLWNGGPDDRFGKGTTP